jgi:hypothetical protein
MATRNANSYAGYHNFVEHDESDESETVFGSFEVFWDDSDVPEHGGQARNYDGEGNPVEPGWYWWPCFPGCLPDGEAIGPFSTSREAFRDAQEDF